MLKQKIQNDVKESLKDGDELRLSVLRMFLASILSKEKEKRYKISKAESGLSEADLQSQSELKDEEIIDVVFSEIKKRKDAIVMFKQGNRPALAEKEEKEAEILKKYLPEQISQEELKKIAKSAIEKIGAKGIKDMGKVMAEMMPKIKGKAEAGLVSKIVKELLFTP
jgi:uncharacterized protein